jgi:TRAP transporter 4TM/12TM fusion protein
MSQIELDRIERLEAEYDPELRFRPIIGNVRLLITAMLVCLSLYHYVTAGMGPPQHRVHTGLHLAMVLSLIFLVFPVRRQMHNETFVTRWPNIGNVPVYDWILFAIALAVPLFPAIVMDNVGGILGTYTHPVNDPSWVDILLGTTMMCVVLESTRRAMGKTLPIICIGFIIYSLYGNNLAAPLYHRGNSWESLVNYIYLSTDGIYGLTVLVIASYVFHFVLFGIFALRIGLGELFLDIAYCVAGRFAGGPAKISIMSSALVGMISGSSIANTVSTGAYTIPAMKRIGYQPHFAAAVAAAASTGGQITPPIMGAAAFLMIEFLGVPYQEIVIAAIVPALMHFVGVLTMVHLEAKRLGLKGLAIDEMPAFRTVLSKDWPALLPLVLLIFLIAAGYTPDIAAFWGITACIAVGFANPRNRMSLRQLIETLQLGAKYGLAIGGAAATSGIIVGIVMESGLGYKISYLINAFSADFARILLDMFPYDIFSAKSATLLFTLFFVGIACTILGAGLPTTATYIVLVSLVIPALTSLDVEPIVAHFFVLFYGVLADLTPPSAPAAYAGAGIAGASPFRSSLSAIRLGNAKALVPVVFIFSPSLLLVTQAFYWPQFIVAFIGCLMGVLCLAAALTGYVIAPMGMWQRWLLGCAALVFAAPGLTHELFGLTLAAPALMQQLWAYRAQRRSVSSPP